MTSSEFVDCHGLPAGSRLLVETRNRQYEIECVGGSAIRISGHPEYCPTPVDAFVLDPLIERGKHLQFLLSGRRPVVTSRVMHLRVHQPAPHSSTIH